jgi:hypothetical protein
VQNRKKIRLVLIAIVALCLAVLPQISPTAKAAGPPQFSSIAVRLDNTNGSTSGTPQYTGGTVCVATPASYTGHGTENYVDIGFPNEQGVTITSTTDFQVSTTLTNWNVNTTIPASATNAGQNYWPLLGNATNTAWPLIATNPATATNGPYVSGASPAQTTTLKVVRFAATTAGTAFGLNVSTTYCFNFTGVGGCVGTPASPCTSSNYALENSYAGLNGWQENVPGYVATYDCSTGCATVGAGTEIMTSNWGTQLEGDTGNTSNQIVVTAVVPPIFEMTFGANTDSFKTNLDPNTPVVTNGVGITVATNAKGGWVVWTESANQKLVSASSGGTIDSVGWNADAPTTLASGTAAYALDVGVTSGVGTSPTLCGPTNTPAGAEVAPEYAGSLGPTYTGGALEPNWAQIADCSTSTPPGTDGGTTVTLTELAEITFSTPAATDYTDTLYVTGAGQF